MLHSTRPLPTHRFIACYYFTGFMLPTLIGNIIGGVSLVAALNFAQVAAETLGTA